MWGPVTGGLGCLPLCVFLERESQAVDAWHAWDSNPLYVILHESIYCQARLTLSSLHPTDAPAFPTDTECRSCCESFPSALSEESCVWARTWDGVTEVTSLPSLGSGN